jgi:UDP-2-acetamido-3-amino-2,3-dideoxy-glucuronate N-acetyltransferase
MNSRLDSTTAEAAPQNIAVIGCGYWGRNLVRIFAELGALHTICDSDPQNFGQLGQLYPHIEQETKFEWVLANREISGVVIATPAGLHYAMTKQALEAGKDVFVEKPLSLSVNEGRELVDLAEKTGRVLMVGHLLEYHPAIVKLKELIDSGELGKVNYIYSNRLNLGKFRAEENILWSFAPHDISVILRLLGEMPQQVSAHGGQYLNQGIADVTVSTIKFRGGTNAHIFVSWLHPYKEQKLVVIGDRRMAVFDDVSPENKLVLYENCIEWRGRAPVPHRQEAIPVKFTMVEPLKLECQDFINCLMSRQKPRTDGRSGLKVLKILDACQQSLEKQGADISLAGNGYYVHPTSTVEEPANIGEGTKVWHFSHIMPNATIGKNCTIGQNVFIARNVSIGNNVKIENNVSVFEGVILKDDVFCGPSCVFTNIRAPRSRISQKGSYVPTTVNKGATIGANATIVCGQTIGSYSFIGAGAVVTRDVPDYALVYGNTARIQGWVCRCGTRLDFNRDSKAICSSCGSEYVKQENEGQIKIERIINPR